jgi:putative acetyltransferase
LRAEGVVLLSLVAQVEQPIVGHILFSRMWIETGQGLIAAAALAPIAVVPDYQRRGIGGQLIRRGLDGLRDQGERIVIVLGHPHYYSRFGFSNDKARALESPFPPEAFMAMELTSGALDGIYGKVRYPEAFEV